MMKNRNINLDICHILHVASGLEEGLHLPALYDYCGSGTYFVEENSMRAGRERK